jgi:formylglycine-generating enzyme required for sulfatase activity
MVRIEGFCIDATEVTRGQYQAFLASTPKLADQTAGCEGNTSFTQRNDTTAVELDPPAVPVSVTWCDAFAYCRWAGKRLCGAIDGGGPVPYQTPNATENEWLFACTGGGTRTYPYGQDYVPDRCNVDHHDGGDLAAVGSFPACQGGFDDIFDMSGNAREWTNDCDVKDSGPTGDDQCVFRGGSFDESVWLCSKVQATSRTTSFYGYGFRCCATAH